MDKNLLKEAQFHEDFWRVLLLPQLKSKESIEEIKSILAENSLTKIPFKLLLDTILLLLEVNKDKTIVAGQIREKILGSSRSKAKESEIERNNEIAFEGEIIIPLDKLVGKFRKLFIDRTKIMNIYLTKEKSHEKKPEVPVEKIYDFKPKINEKSKKQDTHDNYISKLVHSGSVKEIPDEELPKNRFDLLYNYSKYENKKKEEETKSKIQEETLRNCTFAPKINKKIIGSGKKKTDRTENGEKSSPNHASNENETPSQNPASQVDIENDTRKAYEKLYDLYKKKFEREQLNTKLLQEREDEKLIACTFKPQLNSSKNLEKSLYSSNTNNVKGADKVIGRVAKAREERQEKQTIFENMGKPKGDPLQATTFQPFSFEKRYEKEVPIKEEPLLYLDINYGPGKIARIPVRKTDDPHVLCKTFSKIYSLNEKMQTTLLETIQNIFLTQVWEEKKNN